MKRPAIRILLAVVLVAAIQAVAYTTKNAEVGVLEVDLSEMPLILGDWTGKKVKMDDLIFDKTGADVMVSREYANDVGPPVGVTTSVFSNWHVGLQHHPRSCYKGAGFELVDKNVVPLTTARRAEFPVDVWTYERDDKRMQVLFWYQLGDQSIIDRTDLGRARWNLPRGEPRPPLLKVMIQTSQDDPQRAQDRLKGFAEHVLSFTDGPSS